MAEGKLGDSGPEKELIEVVRLKVTTLPSSASVPRD